MKNKIPDRWLEYSPMGSKVAGTRFIAFKAPLSKEICAKMKASDRFTPEVLMDRCPNMRLIIDLTNTDRYYNKQEFIDRGIQYEKIMCPGQVIPPQSLIFRFFEIIDDFYLKNGLKDVLIGIHCTHGVNRTGYFIGRYMVQRMGFHYEKAIPCIEEARGHKIERINYIKDLMVQVPIPSSLSSSSGKKVIESKPDFRKGNNNTHGKVPSKAPRERTPDKPFGKKPPVEYREPLTKPTHRKSNDPPPFRPKEPPMRSGNYGPPSGRPFSPVRHGNSPAKRGSSPVRRGFSPVRRPPSPGRRGGRMPSPKRFRTPPRSFSPRRRASPPRRSPPRRMSPPRREEFAPPPFRGGEEREFSRNAGPRRSFSPQRRPEPTSYSSRGPPEGSRGYGSSSTSWQPPYDNRGFGLSSNSGNMSNYGPPPVNQFSDSRPPERQSWESRSNNHPSFSGPKPTHSSSGPGQWNSGSNFSAPPPPNVNMPPPNFDSRSGASSQSGRLSDRRFDDNVFPSSSRDESRRNWMENRSSSGGPPLNSGRFDEGKGFPERGNDYRFRPEEKFEKPYRSPPRDYNREKRPPSPPRDYPRNFDLGLSRMEPSWEGRRRSPEPPFGDFNRGGAKRRSRSPGRRPSPPLRRSRSPRRRSPPPRSGFESRRSPPRNRPADVPPPRNRSNDPGPFNPPFEAPPSRPPPDLPYQDKRYYESRDDCRDLLNQKRHFEGDRDFYSESKAPKLDLRVIPKEVDLRKVIRGSNTEPPLKDRLGPPPRDEPPIDVSKRYGRGRSRSPRGRSPPRYGPPRRY